MTQPKIIPDSKSNCCEQPVYRWDGRYRCSHCRELCAWVSFKSEIVDECLKRESEK